MKVLVVDDDKLARKGLISIMDWKKYGFEVVGDVQNGRKALEFLKDNEVDIVFTDIDMPEIDGIELMKMCKKEYPEVKFVVFSMYEAFRYAQSALRLGALDYISKISFEGDECDRILELVERKYKENHSQKETRNEDSELIKRLEKAWMNTRWIFNDSEFNRLYELTRGVELRTAERVFIKSFHSLQKLTGEELEFPSLSSVDSMLEWVKQEDLPKVSGDIADFHRNVVAVIRDGAEPEIKLFQVMRVMKLMEAIFQAAETKQVIEFQDQV